MQDIHRNGDRSEEAYLKLVGDRVRFERVRRGLSRKALSEASGVSERYLAELERGTGNASLLVLHRIAGALGTAVSMLASEEADRSVDLVLVTDHLERPPAANGGLPSRTGGTRKIPAEPAGPRPPPSASRLALIGLRGAGKSTVGAAAAHLLGVPFVELDEAIEQAAGSTLAGLLASHGSGVYRMLERECLEAALERHPRAVIAASGGIVTEPETYGILLSSCRVIWLKASPEQHISRAIKKGDLRPAARHRRVLDEFRLVLDSRAPLYARAHHEIDTTGKDKDTVVAAVLAIAAR